MKYDGKIDIALGHAYNSKVWKNKKMLWSDFLKKIAEPVRTSETFKEFISASKAEQHKIKDVGGYVAGYLRGGKRLLSSVVHKQMLTLDIDFAHANLWDDFSMVFGNASILHATHKHCEASPRYRILMPLSREVAPEEYVACARKVAEIIGIDLFDNTTFDVNRLMFWPSVPKDVEYYMEWQDGEWLDPDYILGLYADWRDSSLWATSDLKMAEIHDATKKQEDPELKKGIVGAWCRTYGIAEAIEKFLPDVYEPSTEGRYTYMKGTTASGLIVYDDKFAYSHHGTDPCSGKLSNSFDLVRVHLFGHLDHDSQREGVKSKSFEAMEAMARDDKATKKTIAKEKISSASYDFGDLDDVDDLMGLSKHDDIEDEDPEGSEEDTEWMADLEVDGKSNYLSSANNLNLIFANDPRLKNAFKSNLFDSKKYISHTMPWRRITKSEPIKNVDYSGVRNYIESVYGITGSLKIEDSLNLAFEKNSFHPVQQYLGSLQWDKVPRVDSLLIDLFGAQDNIYTREAIRKMLVASVARVFKAGTKHDLVLVLVGREQGTGKSSFIKRLGREWFSDTFMTVHGKEALEQIQGSWIIEMAELSGLKKAEVESIKHFISKQEDNFRPAYAKTSETFPRQCTFWGTTNSKDFLRDPSGNRRFMPIDVHDVKVTENAKMLEFLQDDDLLDQIWAEAVHLYRSNEPLYLSREAERIAVMEQRLHSETDERAGIVEQYLETPLPSKWDEMDLYDRREYLSNEDMRVKGTEIRDVVCVAEIWCECLGKDKSDLSRYNSREINDIMKGHPEWEASKSTKSFKLYGTQKYFIRKLM